MKTDKVKLWHLVFTVVVALCGIAASWGASRVSVAQAATEVVAIKSKVEEAEKQIQDLKIGGAVTNETLKNIDKKLDAIQEDLDRLDKKIDSLRK